MPGQKSRMSHPGRSAPAIYAELTVAAASMHPLVAPANPETYPYGRYYPHGPYSEQELPIGYTLQGWMDGEPIIGTSLRVFRMVRNGLRQSGEFRSAIITSVAERAFTTANATFHWQEIEKVIWPKVSDLPFYEQQQFRAWLLGNNPMSAFGVIEGSEFSIFPQDYWNWCEGKFGGRPNASHN